MVSAGGTAGASIGVRLVRRHTPTFDTGLYRMLVASIVLLPFALTTSPFSINRPSLALLAIPGVVHTGAAMTLYAHPLGRVQAQDAVVYGYFEPSAIGRPARPRDQPRPLKRSAVYGVASTTGLRPITRSAAIRAQSGPSV